MKIEEMIAEVERAERFWLRDEFNAVMHETFKCFAGAYVMAIIAECKRLREENERLRSLFASEQQDIPAEFESVIDKLMEAPDA